ncbi:hypothetical protein L596_020852 [Steinernema carpocapsae]|uniref:Uncharacterized protein n=1 Tax=Steinernema carpocapsae TaxID=34508 RepID=A0A4U5MUZ1_STECR|nr:hypothetical protein L596_020852 [Steinernema carpocapsae]
MVITCEKTLSCDKQYYSLKIVSGTTGILVLLLSLWSLTNTFYDMPQFRDFSTIFLDSLLSLSTSFILLVGLQQQKANLLRPLRMYTHAGKLAILELFTLVIDANPEMMNQILIGVELLLILSAKTILLCERQMAEKKENLSLALDESANSLAASISTTVTIA